MLVEVRELVIDDLLLLSEATIGGLVLQLALDPVDQPYFNLVERLSLQVVEVDVQLAALHHLHYYVAQGDVEMPVLGGQGSQLLGADSFSKLPQASCLGEYVRSVAVELAQNLKLGVALDVLSNYVCDCYAIGILQLRTGGAGASGPEVWHAFTEPEVAARSVKLLRSLHLRLHKLLGVLPGQLRRHKLKYRTTQIKAPASCRSAAQSPQTFTRSACRTSLLVGE